eukprot:CAMPEP_0177230216 /NCGR_PEP_ID=MMETSP0367-20130122/42108_1 /TAXON_ID=447022 ORGANISM="Scrippsiella hangoei-like, Strain SHHI-4" /NCGR_SAMPLE_ID=MMETSP0367 /ASSEMBLY_ACC=CAM_ASM_000362 /LENGTH=69 /DNA_ID=CAMNT_0018680655 /DNA_START=483 /DNA_END=688 /DNA_ORIENTATION=+
MPRLLRLRIIVSTATGRAQVAPLRSDDDQESGATTSALTLRDQPPATIPRQAAAFAISPPLTTGQQRPT